VVISSRPIEGFTRDRRKHGALGRATTSAASMAVQRQAWSGAATAFDTAWACGRAAALWRTLMEMPNKLRASLVGRAADALSRLGAFIGAPTEVGLRDIEDRGAGAVVAFGLRVGMIVVFLTLNLPVNTAAAGWHANSLPADWTAYRARVEIGYGLAAVFARVGLFATLKASRFGS
jgi:hypothetical protein